MVKKSEKKWSREQCRTRYVQGEKIGIRTLSKLANRSHGTVGTWSSEDNWTGERERYHNELRTKTEEKVIEATSDRLADELVKMNEEHIRGAELFRKMSQQFAGILATEIQQINQSDRSKTIINKEFSLALQRYSGIFATAVQLQRQATGMQYLDLDKAVSEVIKAGYDVSEPQD